MDFLVAPDEIANQVQDFWQTAPAAGGKTLAGIGLA
jgi:hypothetical protein